MALVRMTVWALASLGIPIQRDKFAVSTTKAAGMEGAAAKRHRWTVRGAAGIPCSP